MSKVVSAVAVAFLQMGLHAEAQGDADPVAALEGLLPAIRSASTVAEAVRPMSRGGFRKDSIVAGEILYDVKRTDSMVTPIAGEVQVNYIWRRATRCRPEVLEAAKSGLITVLERAGANCLYEGHAEELAGKAALDQDNPRQLFLKLYWRDNAWRLSEAVVLFRELGQYGSRVLTETYSQRDISSGAAGADGAERELLRAVHELFAPKAP